MARVFNGSSQYLETITPVVTSLPVTFSCWIYATAISRFQCAMCISRGTHGTNNDLFRLMAYNTNVIEAASFLGTTPTVSTTSGTISANTWHHLAATFSAASGQYAWLDTTKSTSGGNSQSPASLDRTSIGRQYVLNTQFFPFQGRVAFSSVWNAVLSDDEIASLGQKLNGVPCGVHPTRIRPESLVACWPLGGFDGDHDGDIWADAYNLTAYNSPTWDEGPAVLYSVPPQIIYPASAGGDGGGSPLTSWWAWNQFGTPLDHGARN